MSMQLTTIRSHCPSSSLPILSRPEPERNIAKMFIENGIDFNVQDSEFRSAPHCLSENKSDNLLDVYELLIENGADVNGRNFKQENALHLLCKNNYQREYLIEIIRYFATRESTSKTLLMSTTPSISYADTMKVMTTNYPIIMLRLFPIV